MLIQLFWRGGAQMGREKGGGENAPPLEHLAPSKPHSALSKPAVGSLPWLVALLSSPPPLPVPEPSPESALSCWGEEGSDPFLLREGTLALELQGPLLFSSGAGTTHSLKQSLQGSVSIAFHQGKHDLSPGVKPEAQSLHFQALPQWKGAGIRCLASEGGRPRSRNLVHAGGRITGAPLGAPESER